MEELEIMDAINDMIDNVVDEFIEKVESDDSQLTEEEYAQFNEVYGSLEDDMDQIRDRYSKVLDAYIFECSTTQRASVILASRIDEYPELKAKLANFQDFIKAYHQLFDVMYAEYGKKYCSPGFEAVDPDGEEKLRSAIKDLINRYLLDLAMFEDNF